MITIIRIFFIAHARNGGISTSDLKSDVTIVFLDPDFVKVAKISALRLKIDQEMRPWKCLQTDRQTGLQTDANRFYNMSRAICYSCGTYYYFWNEEMYQCWIWEHTGSCMCIAQCAVLLWNVFYGASVCHFICAQGHSSVTLSSVGGALHNERSLAALHAFDAQSDTTDG